ncbi:hypothetical protein G6F45_014232 [Rhizopus arrhizus]|nr:hypothetical protein G6F45_014232 [Rhizopus arrhizus]
MVLNEDDSDPAAALTAHQKFKDCEEKVNRAKEALKSFSAMFEETKTPADGPMLTISVTPLKLSCVLTVKP